MELGESAPLADVVPQLFSGGGIRAPLPDIMEEYGQRWVFVVDISAVFIPIPASSVPACQCSCRGGVSLHARIASHSASP